MVGAVFRRPTSPETSPLPSSEASEFRVSLPSDYPSTGTSDYESICWGCGLRLILPSYAPIYKCGWCGAITNQNAGRNERKSLLWRRVRDRCFVSTLIIFMLFVICGGVWAVYPVVFSASYLCGAIHSMITIILSVSTISMFMFAAFRNAGEPPTAAWGSYPAVGMGDLDNYTFCQYCSKPKSPRTHHCHSCRSCVLDMDHHCPFIGNCVGAANLRYFINFLISAIISMSYVTFMSLYIGLKLSPSSSTRTIGQLHGISSNIGVVVFIKQSIIAFLSSAVFLSLRGLLLVYLFIASMSVEIGLSVLLWQQLRYIYQGKTYLGHLSSQGEDEVTEKGCKNLYRFFGCPFSPSRSCCGSEKHHRK